MCRSDVAGRLVRAVVTVHDVDQHGLDEPQRHGSRALASGTVRVGAMGAAARVGLADVRFPSLFEVGENHLLGHFEKLPRLRVLQLKERADGGHGQEQAAAATYARRTPIKRRGQIKG